MSNHKRTWKLWLETISVLGRKTKQVGQATIDAMAESISLAAPEGPRGFPCKEVGCDCASDGMIIRRMTLRRARMMEQALKGMLETHPPNEWVSPERAAAISFARAALVNK